MKKIYLILILFFSCTNEVNIPDDIMSKGEMIEFLFDVNLINSSRGFISKSNNNYHDIISTTNDCIASCCSGNNTVEKVWDSKEKSNNQKIKKKFKWFSRSK